MRYNITITGELDTWADESRIQSDAPAFLADVERVHPGIVPGTVELISVERLPDPAPVAVDTAAPFADMDDDVLNTLARLISTVQASRQA